MIANRSRHLVPSCASSTRCTLAAASGGASRCSLVSASRYGLPYCSGIAASMTESACPTFIAPPLSSPSTVNSCWAALSMNSALTSSLDLPVSRLPKPNAARPAMPTGKLASLALRAARPRLMSVTNPSSITFLSDLRRLGNKRFQHPHRGCRDHRRATIAPVLTSNSSVVSSVGGGSAEEPASSPRRTARITRSTWLSASAAVASTVARSALPTVSRSCDATAGHAASRSLRCRSAQPKQLVYS